MMKYDKPFNVIGCYNSALWPDWAIFDSFRWQIFLQKKPKSLVTFWAILENINIEVKAAVSFFR